MTTPVTVEENETSKKEQEIVLSVQKVAKKFCRDLRRSFLYGLQDIANELVGKHSARTQLRHQEFWALKDVSFELRRGEALGLIGQNGSGKTTLMRIIAGIIKPDLGEIEIKGQIAPLIALGAGFNSILTGRENVYANMSILGLSNQEINERFEDVVKFAELEDAIDTPLQNYSSGMAARLGFSCAIHTDPDILLIDEVLAVGDSRFRGKCFQKLHELRSNGTSFILVSHNAHAILTVCDTAVYLKPGKLVAIGDTNSVINQYEKDLFLPGTEQTTQSISFLKKRETDTLNIHSLLFRDSQGKIIESPVSGQPTYFCLKCQVDEKIDDVGISLIIKELGKGGETVLLFNSFQDGKPINFLPGEHEIQVYFPYLGLRLGVYVMDVFAKKERLYHLDAIESFRFTVEGGEEVTSRSLFYQPRMWKIAGEENCQSSKVDSFLKQVETE